VDGVCADFIRPALTLLDLAPEATLERWRTEYAGDFYPEALMGMSREVFFDRIDAHGASFWRKLPAYSWFPGLHSDLASLGDVMFLSAPTGYPACLAGKYAWLCDFFGSHYRDCIFTLHKDRLAHQRAILIDDSDQNIEAFRRRGGHGIVFPQVWNSAGACDEPAAHVVAAVSALIKAGA
jgi:hypothetical protein